MANQIKAKVAVPPAKPLAYPLPMDWQSQEKVPRDKRDMDFLRQEYTEVASIEKNICSLVANLPTTVDSDECSEAVADLAYMVEALQEMANPECPDATRGARIASAMVRDMFDLALKDHKITTIFPVCIRHHKHKDDLDRNEEEVKKMKQVLATYNASQRGRTKENHRFIPYYLSRINRETYSLTCKASRNVPLAALSLDEDMLADATTHAPLLLAIAQIPAIHQTCFSSLAQDGGEASWNRYVGRQGKIAHPLRLTTDPHPTFESSQWTKSVIHHEQLVQRFAGETLAVDHALPSYQGLKRCFKKLEADRFSSQRKTPYDARNRGHQARYYYLEREVVSHLALLFGDIVYRMMLHVDRLPSLNAGKAHAFHEKDLPGAVVTLGIYLHMCLSYQTCTMKLVYDQFGLTDLSAVFDYPVAEAEDPFKMVSYCYKHSNLGEKRLLALPYLLQARGMRGYQEFLKDTDAYVAKMKGSIASVIDEVTGFVTNARERCDQINLLRLQTTGAVPEAAGNSATNALEEPQPNRRPDCKFALFIFSIFECLCKLILSLPTYDIFAQYFIILYITYYYVSFSFTPFSSQSGVERAHYRRKGAIAVGRRDQAGSQKFISSMKSKKEAGDSLRYIIYKDSHVNIQFPAIKGWNSRICDFWNLERHYLLDFLK